MSAAALLEAAEVRILRLQPGDEIIMTVHGRAESRQALRDLKQTAEERWPGYRVTVLHSGISMEIKRKTQSQDSKGDS